MFRNENYRDDNQIKTCITKKINHLIEDKNNLLQDFQRYINWLTSQETRPPSPSYNVITFYYKLNDILDGKDVNIEIDHEQLLKIMVNEIEILVINDYIKYLNGENITLDSRDPNYSVYINKMKIYFEKNIDKYFIYYLCFAFLDSIRFSISGNDEDFDRYYKESTKNEKINTFFTNNKDFLNNIIKERPKFGLVIILYCIYSMFRNENYRDDNQIKNCITKKINHLIEDKKKLLEDFQRYINWLTSQETPQEQPRQVPGTPPPSYNSIHLPPGLVQAQVQEKGIWEEKGMEDGGGEGDSSESDTEEEKESDTEEVEARAQQERARAQQEALEREQQEQARAQQEALELAQQEALKREQQEQARALAQQEALERAQQEQARELAQQEQARELAQQEALKREQQEALKRAQQEQARALAQQEALERAQQEQARLALAQQEPEFSSPSYECKYSIETNFTLSDIILMQKDNNSLFTAVAHGIICLNYSIYNNGLKHNTEHRALIALLGGLNLGDSSLKLRKLISNWLSQHRSDLKYKIAFDLFRKNNPQKVIAEYIKDMAKGDVLHTSMEITAIGDFLKENKIRFEVYCLTEDKHKIIPHLTVGDNKDIIDMNIVRIFMDDDKYIHSLPAKRASDKQGTTESQQAPDQAQRNGSCKYNNDKNPKFTKDDLIINKDDNSSFFNAVAYGIACLGYIIKQDGSGLSFYDEFQDELPNPNVNRVEDLRNLIYHWWTINEVTSRVTLWEFYNDQSLYSKTMTEEMVNDEIQKYIVNINNVETPLNTLDMYAIKQILYDNEIGFEEYYCNNDNKIVIYSDYKNANSNYNNIIRIFKKNFFLKYYDALPPMRAQNIKKKMESADEVKTNN